MTLIKVKIPLIKDHHNHPSFYAGHYDCVDLRYITRKETAITLIREKNADEVNLILGWNNSLYNFSKEELDSLPPVFICNVSLHMFLVNEAAINKLSAHKEIVSHLHDIDWVEKNLIKVYSLISTIKPLQSNKIKEFYDYLLDLGTWYAEENSLANETVIDSFRKYGLLDRTLIWADIGVFLSLTEKGRKEVFGIKIFLDGALGAKTAALKELYITGENGILLFAEGELYSLLEKVCKLNKAVSLHAIGDVAIEQAIDALDRLKTNKGEIPITRLEHVQFISPDYAKKAKSLGIVLSVQPTFSCESECYSDRISKKYCLSNNPFRMLIDDIGYTPGKDLLFGSDGMPHDFNFSLQMSLFPPSQTQELTLKEFVAGYCMPDMKNGYINLNIDDSKRTVVSEVVLK